MGRESGGRGGGGLRACWPRRRGGVTAAAAAPAAGASVPVRFERIAGYDAPGTPKRLDKVGILKIGAPGRAQRPRPEPGHVGQRRLLRAAGARHRRQRSPAGRCGRSSAARTCSRTSRCSTAPRPARPRRSRLFDYYLGWLARPEHHDPLPARSRTPTVAYAQAVGDADRDRGPPPRRRARPQQRAPTSSSAATRSAARSRPPTRRGTSTARPGAEGLVRPRLHRRRQQPDAGDAGRRDGRRSQTSQRRLAWLAFGGIPAPFAGLFNSTGALGGAHGPRLAVDRPGSSRCCRRTSSRRSRSTNLGPVRLRAGHRDLAAGAGRRAGPPRPPGRERRPARLGPGGRDHADPALREDVRRAGA